MSQNGNGAINGQIDTLSSNTKRRYMPQRVAKQNVVVKKAKKNNKAADANNNIVVEDTEDIIVTKVSVLNGVKTCDNYKERASVVKRVDEVQFVLQHQKLLKKIEKDPILRENFKMEFSPDGHPEVFRMRAKQLRRVLDRISPLKSRTKRTTLKELEQFLQGIHYAAPNIRIVVSPNITTDSRDICPMFSDVPGETLETLTISAASSFQYIYRNQLGKLQDHEKFVNAEREKHAIQCECKSEENMVPCWLNPECKCSNFNKLLATRQTGRKNSLTTFDKVLFDSAGHFYDSIAVACSEECGCRGRCSNNLTYLAEQNLFPTEVYRKDKQIEFRLRAMSAIPAGTPFLEFNGAVVDEEDLLQEEADYAFKVFHRPEKCLKFLSFRKQLSDEQRKILRGLHGREWYIDPKAIGNKARFVSHSCEPNVELVRVFQKSFSPAHIRLFYVTSEDIFPGTELSIDYGGAYLDGEIEKKCGCEKLSCRNNKDVLKVAKASVKTLEEYYAARHRNEFRRFESEVLNKL